MSYQFSQEAKKRISALGQAAVADFIDEISLDLRKGIYDRLPRVQGFRPGTPAELKEKQKRLIGRLIHPQSSQTSDWRNFALLWEVWARQRFGPMFPPGDNLEPTLGAAINFLKILVNNFPRAAREDMERLFIFSGFPDCPEAVEMFECFRPASSLARDLMIDELPVRLGEIENRLVVTEAAVTSAADRIEGLEVNSSSLARNIEKAAGEIDQNINAITELQVALNAESTRSETIERTVNALDIAGKRLADVAISSETRTDILEQRVQELVARGGGWDGLAVEVAELKVAVSGLIEREPDRSGTTEIIGVLTERVAALEGILAGSNSGLVTRPRVKLIENNPEGPLFDIVSVGAACATIASNLLAVGVTKGAAVGVARQTVAALIAGQIAQFSGSLADLAADAVAAAVGGPAYHEWRVPVGLVSDEATSDCVEVVTELSGCLLLKGANLSAFEVYGAAVRDIVVRRQFSASSNERLALIASWAQGPAAFSNGGTLAELGPVFDTDTLPMRGVSAKLPQLTFGRLMKESWEQLEGLNNDAFNPAVSELGERLREVGFEGGGLWKRIANHAYAILSAMPGGTPEADLHSLLVSWAIPWAKAMGGPVEEIARIAARELDEQRAEVAV